MSWYATNAGNDFQGIVVDEKTGKNIAVAYDKKDTPLLAAAPEMRALLIDAVQLRNYEETHNDCVNWPTWFKKVQDVLNQIEDI